jgi:hypothetical protein
MQVKFRDEFGLPPIFLSTPFELCLRTFGKFATGNEVRIKSDIAASGFAKTITP